MTVLRMLAVLAWLVMISPPPAAGQGTAPAPASVLMSDAVIIDPGRPPIPVIIWAPSTGARLPLVLISHGTGAAPLSHIDTAEALAKAGFVVVALMHPGDNFQDDSAVGKPAWFADRSRNVSRAIDYMLVEWESHSRLAPDKIGIFGFSAGATTALISIGGVPDLGRITPHCARVAEFACRLFAPQVAIEATQWTYDPRIGAAVVAAPAIGFAFEPAGLSNVRVPVQLWSGTADETVPYETNTAIVRRLLPRVWEFRSVEGAVHLSFLAPCTSETPQFLCRDKPGFDRATFHEAFNRAVVAFLRDHLQSQTP